MMLSSFWQEKEAERAASEARARICRPTYAQRRDMWEASAVLHDLLRPMSGDAVRGLIRTALADSGIAPADLDRLGNELSRMAWEMQRGIE